MGVVSVGVPYWSWFAGSVGTCHWIHGDEDAMVHGIDKPRFVEGKEMTLKDLMRDDPVKIVLFDGCWPGVNSAVWACPDISYVVWFHSASNRLVVPQGWLLESRALQHSEFGGVTNGGFRCRVA
jgi:hypothetical protein